MANVKISQLPSLSTMTDIAQIPVVAGGTTYQITGSNLSSYFGGGYGNANVVANLAALGSNPVSTTGNVTSGNLLTGGLINAAGNITGSNLSAVNLVINNIRSDDSSFVNIEDGVNITGAIDASGNITGNLLTGGRVVTTPVAYSTLTAVTGARAFVNDGNLVASGNFGAQVSGGGANTVPVWSNGTNWYIG